MANPFVRARYLLSAHTHRQLPPDGGFEVAFHGEYRAIVPDERVVSTEVFEGAPVEDPDANGTLNTVTFEESDEGTTLTTVVECFSTETRDAIIGSGMEGGMQEAFDKLEQVAGSIA